VCAYGAFHKGSPAGWMVKKAIKRMLFPFVVTVRCFYAGLKQYSD
jgi:hypothetical protein